MIFSIFWRTAALKDYCIQEQQNALNRFYNETKQDAETVEKTGTKKIPSYNMNTRWASKINESLHVQFILK